MSNDSSYSSSDDDCYVNAAAKYKKAVREKIIYTEEEEKVPDFYSVPFSERASSISPNLRSKSNHVASPIQIVDQSDTNNPHTSENSPDSTGRRSTRSTRSTRSGKSTRSQTRSSARIKNSNDQNLETIALDDSLCESRNAEFDDYICLGSPDVEERNDEDCSLTLKIIWRSKDVIKLTVHKYEPIRKLFKHFAELENIPEEKILLMKKDRIIRPTDTAVSLGLTVVDILEGGIVSTSTKSNNAIENKDDKDLCQIKVQSANCKPFVMSIRKDESFNSVIHSCSQKFEVPIQKIKLYFDGEQITADDTPESLDLEQEACVDLRIINN